MLLGTGELRVDHVMKRESSDSHALSPSDPLAMPCI